MRTTLTLDPDVATRLNAEAARSDRAFKAVVNDALRRGLHMPSKSPRRAAYTVKPLRLAFRPGVDTDRLNELADELETEVFVKKLRT
ncbi:MAG TPA: CopG family transcriptional regulator [Lacunisphaera sp.]|nr:CopG family transcriptional regulator [Lacunisphaera sp.]